MMKIIGLDARLSGRKNAGLGRYIQNLALRLPFLLPENYQLVYFFEDKTQWSEIISNLKTLDLTSGPSALQTLSKIKIIIAPIKHYSISEQLEMPKYFNKENLDLVHVPHFNAPYFTKQKLVVTIHDLLWHEKKGTEVTTLKPWQYHFKYLAYRLLTNRVVRQAKTIIVPSQTIKKTLLSFYPRIQKKVTVIYNGVSNLNKTASEKNFSQQLPSNFLLYVGSLYPHKNVELILKALQKRPELNLVIVSARNAFWEKLALKIKELQVSGQVIFLGQISDGQLKYLYQTTQALIQPSFSEGFGLTGVEALACGTKVLATKIPVFCEIYDQSFFSFDPLDEKSFLDAYDHSLLVNQEEYSIQAIKQAQKYDWWAMSRQVAQIYQNLTNEKN